MKSGFNSESIRTPPDFEQVSGSERTRGGDAAEEGRLGSARRALLVAGFRECLPAITAGPGREGTARFGGKRRAGEPEILRRRAGRAVEEESPVGEDPVGEEARRRVIGTGRDVRSVKACCLGFGSDVRSAIARFDRPIVTGRPRWRKKFPWPKAMFFVAGGKRRPRRRGGGNSRTLNGCIIGRRE